MSWVLNHSPTKGTEKIVLLGLANHADADGNNAYPSVARLATYANVTERAVQMALRELEKSGHIVRQFQAGGSAKQRADRRPNLYSVITNNGVKYATSRSENGVKPTAERGEVHGTDGVKPTAPETSLEPSLEPSIYPALSEHLCNLLADGIESSGFTRPEVTANWIKDMEKLLRIDKREVWQVEKAIAWVSDHDFWSMNIRSPQKLRTHFERLRVEAQKSQKKTEPRGFSAIRDFLSSEVS